MGSRPACESPFGFAMTLESVAAPITAFKIAPLTEFLLIPYMASEAGCWGSGTLAGSR